MRGGLKSSNVGYVELRRVMSFCSTSLLGEMAFKNMFMSQTRCILLQSSVFEFFVFSCLQCGKKVSRAVEVGDIVNYWQYFVNHKL